MIVRIGRTVNTAGALYDRTGSYVLANLTVNYDMQKGVEIGAGVGGPENGRNSAHGEAWSLGVVVLTILLRYHD